MSDLPFIRAEALAGLIRWPDVVDALRQGHLRPQAAIDDIHLSQGDNALLSRAAWIPGLGIGVKTATIFPGNARHGLPSVHSVCALFDDHNGTPVALVDGSLVTYLKTAADSLLGARFLSRPDSRTLLIVGAGTVARSLIEGYSACFPNLERILLWNRTPERAQQLSADFSRHPIPVTAVESLEAAARQADIIASATMAKEPVIRGEWIQPGTHVDLIGAFRKDMREADDDLLQRAALYVDARETTLEDIGELAIPIAQGVIAPKDVLGDLYDLCNGTAAGRTATDQITVFKNGGGAHLDLMTARHLLSLWQQGADPV